MNPVLETHKDEIAKLCVKHGVTRLEVFGDANTREFDPERDDFEFIGEFSRGGDMFLRYTDFLIDLEGLLGRPIVVVDEKRLKPGFLEVIAPTREVLFDASNRSVAA